MAPAAQEETETFWLPLAGGAVLQPMLIPLGKGVELLPLLAIEPLAPEAPVPDAPEVPPLVEAPEAAPDALPESELPEDPAPLVAPEDTAPVAPLDDEPLAAPEPLLPEPPPLPDVDVPEAEVPEPETFMLEPPFEVPHATSPMAKRARYPDARIFAEPSILFFAPRLRQRGIAPARTSAVKARHSTRTRCPIRLDSCTTDILEGGQSGGVGPALLASAFVPPSRLRRSVSEVFISIGSIGLLSSMGGVGCASHTRPPETAAAASESSPRSHAARTWGWVGIGLGAEAAVGAVATSVLMLHDKSVRDSNCNAEKVCAPAGIDANQDLGLLSGWNVGAWVVAAAGLGIGGYLVWKDNDDGEHRTAITVTPLGPGAGLGVRSSF